MKKNNILIIVIVLLIVIVVGLSIKLYVLNNDYKEQENLLQETEKSIDLLKEQIEERCPGKFNFVD